jgi:2'-5' RNA ligase
MNGLPRFAFWLVPRIGLRADLQRLIGRLSQEFKAVSFVPHLTLFSCRRPQTLDVAARIAGVAGKFPPITLKSSRLASCAELTRAFYLGLEPTGILLDLVSALKTGIPLAPGDARFEPHLSLLYQQLGPSQREKLLAETGLPAVEIEFDELRVMAIPDRITTTADLLGWQLLACCRLDRAGQA